MNKTLIALVLTAMVPLSAAAAGGPVQIEDKGVAAAAGSVNYSPEETIARADCFRRANQSDFGRFIPSPPVDYICAQYIRSSRSSGLTSQKLVASAEDYGNWVLEWEALSSDPRIIEVERQMRLMTDRSGKVIVGPITEAIIKRNIANAQKDIADWKSRNPFEVVNQASKRELEVNAAQNCEAIKLDAKLATAIIDPIRREAMLKTKRSACVSSRDRAARNLEDLKKVEAERLERARNPWQIEPL